jgi:hypothetical protein
MRKTMMGWVVATVAVAAVFSVPSDARSQSSEDAGRAARLESEASRFLDQPEQWAYAANLYWAAAQLRADGDPQVQEDLKIAANLVFETGDAAGAIAALESGASRALANGNFVQAVNMFADAAWVAQKSEFQIAERMLAFKVAELANSSELTRSERNQIQSRLQSS